MNWNAILFYLPRSFLGAALGSLVFTLLFALVFTGPGAAAAVFSASGLAGIVINFNLIFFSFFFSMMAMSGRLDLTSALGYGMMMGAFGAAITLIGAIFGPGVAQMASLIMMVGLFYFSGSLGLTLDKMLYYGTVFAVVSIILGGLLAGFGGVIAFAAMYAKWLAISYGAYLCVKYTS